MEQAGQCSGSSGLLCMAVWEEELLWAEVALVHSTSCDGEPLLGWGDMAIDPGIAWMMLGLQGSIRVSYGEGDRLRGEQQ